MDLVMDCYRATKTFPKEELYGLTNQLRRAAVSVPANIAEGQGRQTTKAFINYLSIAYGSLCELETQIRIASRLEYVNPQTTSDMLEKAAEIGRMLNGLMRSLKKKLTTDH